MTAAAPRFRLPRQLPPARAVRQLALAQIDHALAGIARGDAPGIHEARKAGKRTRALLRLMRPALGDDEYRRQNLRLRDAGRALSATRDADVLRATARGLGLTAPAAPHTRPRGAAAAHRRATRLLARARRALDRWPQEALTREMLDAALAGGYRRARRAGAWATRRPRTAALHEWRKQVKHHRYHCEAAASLFPPLSRRALTLDALTEALGRHHDLEVLAQALRSHPRRFGEPVVVLRAARRAAREQERLAARALRAGARLFAERPRAWLARQGRP